jgi:hypothetical protein
MRSKFYHAIRPYGFWLWLAFSLGWTVGFFYGNPDLRIIHRVPGAPFCQRLAPLPANEAAGWANCYFAKEAFSGRGVLMWVPLVLFLTVISISHILNRKAD